MRRRAVGRLVVSEELHQRAVIEWACIRTVRIGQLVVPLVQHLYAVPNGAALNSGFRREQMIARLRKLERMGFAPGALDLNLDLACGRWHGMRLEMKSATGRLSDEQREWIDRHRRAGYWAQVAFGSEQAIAALDAYLGLGVVAPEHSPTHLAG